MARFNPDTYRSLNESISKAKAKAKAKAKPKPGTKSWSLGQPIKNEDEFRTTLALARMYSNVADLFGEWSEGRGFSQLGIMAADASDLTPAAKKELEKWWDTFEKMGDKLGTQLDRYDRKMGYD